MNGLKTAVLLVALSLFFLWVGGMIGGRQGMTIALFFALAMNAFAYWFSDKLVLKMYKAQEVDEAAAPELYSVVRRLSSKAGLPMPKVYIIPQDQPNAFATGRNPKHAAVAATEGILKLLSPEELSGVIGHELSHVKHRDILISSVAATVAAAVSYMAQMGQWALIFGGRGGRDRDENPLSAILMLILAPIIAMIIQMAISRSREYSADESGAELAGNPRFLSNALRKLDYYSKNLPMRQATPSTAHMFIVNPLSGKSLLKLFSTHPPIEERIKRLEGGR
ncbi:MAG: zinc metalloprotease HtpX [Nitrospiraceae bacterium]|nr:zinc metalloprotease HtpX [Nitrospiraceae bacterium]